MVLVFSFGNLLDKSYSNTVEHTENSLICSGNGELSRLIYNHWVAVFILIMFFCVDLGNLILWNGYRCHSQTNNGINAAVDKLTICCVLFLLLN